MRFLRLVKFILKCMLICTSIPCYYAYALTYEDFLISPQPDYEGNQLQRTNSEFIYLLAHCTKFYKPLKNFRLLYVQPGFRGSNNIRS